MKLHRNAKLGLAGRFALARAIEGGMSMKAAAAAFNVSSATAHRWSHRWREASREARENLACLADRSSRPHSSPRLLSASAQQQIVRARRRTGWGPRLLAQLTGYAHSTVWKVLRRAGLSRRARPPLEPANRYEWPCPGDLLHMAQCPGFGGVGFLGSGGCGCVEFFIFDWCEHVEAGVASAAVVEDLDVFEDGVGELDPGFPAARVQEFDLHA